MDSNVFVTLFRSVLFITFLLLRASFSYHNNPSAEKDYIYKPGLFSQVGNSNFDDLKTDDTGFIDKSIIVAKYLRTAQDVILITRPRQWGKTVNTMMIKRFLDVETDDDGNRLPEAELRNTRLFEGYTTQIDRNTTKKLKQLQISRYENSVRQQGKIPVLSISFGRVDGNKSIDIERAIRVVIDNMFSQYKFLKMHLEKESKLLTNVDKNRLHLFLTGNYWQADLIDSVRFLSSLLHKHFRRKVHIFIDDFDTPVNKLYFRLFQQIKKSSPELTLTELLNKPFESEEFKEAFRIIRDLFNKCLRNNGALEKALVTGVMRYAKADVFSDLTNLQEYNVMNPEFSDDYGFTRDEIKQFLGSLSLLKKSTDIDYYYKGYNMGGKIMYNPYSIMKYLKEGNKCDDYWVHSGCEAHIDNLFTCKEAEKWISVLVEGGSVNTKISALVRFDANVCDGIFTYLLYAGYLTPVMDNEDNDTNNQTSSGNYYLLKMPNKELKHFYEKRSTYKPEPD